MLWVQKKCTSRVGPHNALSLSSVDTLLQRRVIEAEAGRALVRRSEYRLVADVPSSARHSGHFDSLEAVDERHVDDRVGLLRERTALELVYQTLIRTVLALYGPVEARVPRVLFAEIVPAPASRGEVAC